MSTPPTPSFQSEASQPSSHPQSPDATATRVDVIRAELEYASDPTLKASLLYEVARIAERGGDEGTTVREHLASYNADPTFRPPLHALIRLFEKRRSFKNLTRLYEAEGQSAGTEEERASAMVDLAALQTERLGQASEALTLLEQTIAELSEAELPTVLPALWLERTCIKAGRPEDAIRATLERARTVNDPALKSTLLGESARTKEASGDLDGALSAAREAVGVAVEAQDRHRALRLFEEIAKRGGRSQELVAALEGRAALVGKLSRREVPNDSGEISPSSPPDSDAAAIAGAEAAVLLREAARIRYHTLQDFDGAMAGLRKALSLRPEDLALRREYMLLAEVSGDRARAAEEARYLLERGVVGQHASALHFRIAEAANANGETDLARDELLKALELDPRSAVAAATLEELALASDDIEIWIERLAARADASEGDLRSRLAWYAAHLESTRRGGVDPSAARQLYAKAAQASSEPTAIWREALGAAIRNVDPEGARTAALALLECRDVDDAETSAVLRDLHELERVVLEDDASADAVLHRALGTAGAREWAGDIARLQGAESGNHVLAAEAHALLAEYAPSADASAAHWCASGRARVSANQLDLAASALKNAIAKVPGHRYAVALLEEVYHAQGNADAVVELLRESAEAERAGKDGNIGLLLAGAAAESAGDTALAIRTYREAHEREPDQVAPLLALRRLAEAAGDTALSLEAQEQLARLELAEGPASRESLALAELQVLRAAKLEESEPTLRQIATEGGDLALFAGLDLALMEGAAEGEHSRWREAQVVGVETLFDHSSGSMRTSLMRELGGIALDYKPRMASLEAATFTDLALKEDPENIWALIARMRLSWGSNESSEERAQHILAVADSSMDAETSADLVVQALRGGALSGTPDDDAVFRAIDLEDALPGSEAAAALAIESLTEADDPGERADAIDKWRAHICAENQSAYRSAQARALVAAGRPREAVPMLRRTVEESPDDLASWEALRVAAREIEEWSDVAFACDRLSEYLEGDMRAMLVEEAATVWMDHLGNDDEAETRLRQALFESSRDSQIRIGRDVAYWRLHDLLAERGDERGLLDLVKARARSVDDTEQLVPVYYEIARLHRSLGDRAQALQNLENLMMLDPQHLGGLALLVELRVQDEAWSEAVDALRALASAKDVPPSQQRIARLGAADFLEKKLNDPAAAIEELEAIEALGLADAALYDRMTTLAEAAEQHARAASILSKVSALTFDARERAAVERRAAALYVERLQDPDRAVRAYQRALEAVPTDLEAAERLADLLDFAGRESLSSQLEYSLREVLRQDPLTADAIRGIAMIGRWQGDRALEVAMNDALFALGEANDEERETLEQQTHATRSWSKDLRISDQALLALYAEGLSGPALELAVLACETLADMDKLTLASFGMNRSNQVDLRNPTPLAEEVLGLAALYGAAQAEVAVGGNDPERLTYIPNQRGKPTWIVGGGIHAPMVPVLRYDVGRCALAARIGLAPLVSRTVDQTATDLFAVAAAAGVQFTLAHHRPGITESTKLAQRALSRRVKRGLPEIAQRIHDGGNAILVVSQAAHMTFARGGVIAAGELTKVLTRTMGAAPGRARIAQSPAAFDLFRFWTSSAALAARRELGLSQ